MTRCMRCGGERWCYLSANTDMDVLPRSECRVSAGLEKSTGALMKTVLDAAEKAVRTRLFTAQERDDILFAVKTLRGGK